MLVWVTRSGQSLPGVVAAPVDIPESIAAVVVLAPAGAAAVVLTWYRLRGTNPSPPPRVHARCGGCRREVWPRWWSQKLERRSGDDRQLLSSTPARRRGCADRMPDLLTAVLARQHRLIVVHYDADFEITAQVLGFERR